jgi:hypothetical protein
LLTHGGRTASVPQVTEEFSSGLSSRPARQDFSDDRGRLVDRHPSRLQRAERRRMKETGRCLCEQIIIVASQSLCI